MYVPHLTKNIVSLEWGSHRAEHRLGDAILSEEVLDLPSEDVRVVDPITNRFRMQHISSPTLWRLRNVVFNPKSGRIYFRGHPLKESMRFDEGTRAVIDTAPYFALKRIFDPNSTALRINENYYHFLIEDLPRLLLLKKYGDLSQIFAQKDTPSFAREALDYFRIRRVPTGGPIRMESLLYSRVLGESGVTGSVASNLVRDSFRELSPNIALGKSKLYISRERFIKKFFPTDSRVVPSARVENHLVGSGFEIIQPEQLSFVEQASAFASATTVVAPHGAGLANIIFMQPGSQVVEIMSPNFANPCYEILALGSGLRYSRVYVGESGGAESKLLRDLDDLRLGER